jgi:Flp pilus assembly protein TadD
MILLQAVRRLILPALLLAVIFVSVCQPSSAGAQALATLYSAEGQVESRGPSAAWTPAPIGQAFDDGAELRTGANSRAAVLFSAGLLSRLNEESVLKFGASDGAGRLPIVLGQGMAYFFAREPKGEVVIESEYVTAAIRGTEFTVTVAGDTTVISLLEGALECSNQYGRVELRGGEQAITRKGQAPVKQVLLNPEDAVQWSLYYPAVLDLDDYAEVLSGASAGQKEGWRALQAGRLDEARRAFAGRDWRDALGRSIAEYRAGRIAAATAEIPGFTGHSAGAGLYEAALQLASGQVERAEAALDRARAALPKADPQAADMLRAALLAQEALVALVQNRSGRASELARQAVEASPRSASAALVMSYVEQSCFELGSAREWLDTAGRLVPGSVTVLARRAELALDFGEVEEAWRLATNAVERSPDDSLALAILGFTQLAREDPKGARESFERSIASDSARGLAHLGLGLARIRRGDLAGGREELEKAAHLEPNVAAYRSYLGKAFFEEDRERAAEREYNRAKEIDPRDPTPYLYSAYNNLALVRPIEALWDLEDSIRLNDHRAVYRSKLLLDQDLAVRSSGLAQVFGIIGFTEAARIEAIKSINFDYTNHSAHQLLAESYRDQAALFNAFFAESLLARLLAPVSFNSTRSTDSASVSGNEYSALFDRPLDRTTLGLSGNSKDRAINPTVSQVGAFERFAYGLEYNYQYADGFRDNDFLRNHEMILTMQGNPTYADKIILDSLITFSEAGDRDLGFDPLTNDPNISSEVKDALVRLGYHYAFGPGSHLIAQAAFIRDDLESMTKDGARQIEVNLSQNGRPVGSGSGLQAVAGESDVLTQGGRIDLQHIYDSRLVSLVTGGSLLETTQEREEDYRFIGLPDNLSGFRFDSRADIDENAQRAFSYLTWHLAEALDVNLGANYSHLELGKGSRVTVPFIDDTTYVHGFSPKAGLTLYAGPDLTLRAAYFETIGTASIREFENIEPTLVGGFNQSIKDPTGGSLGESYAFGLDYKLAKRTYTGVEYIHRRLSQDAPEIVSVLDVEGSTFEDAVVVANNTRFTDVRQFSDEDLISAYLYQVFDSHFSGTLDGQIFFDDARRLDAARAIELHNESQTARLRGGLNYFRPDGWFAFGMATWRYQDAQGFSPPGIELDPDPDSVRDFWIFDAGVGYQLPHRRGRIALAVSNLLDERYHYLALPFDEPLAPGRTINLKATVNF